MARWRTFSGGACPAAAPCLGVWAALGLWVLCVGRPGRRAEGVAPWISTRAAYGSCRRWLGRLPARNQPDIYGGAYSSAWAARTILNRWRPRVRRLSQAKRTVQSKGSKPYAGLAFTHILVQQISIANRSLTPRIHLVASPQLTHRSHALPRASVWSRTTCGTGDQELCT